MAGKKVPDRLINFNVYGDLNTVYGVADVELPTITAMTETLSGAGIGGELETTIPGMIEAMEASVNWRTITKDAVKLSAPGLHTLEFRGSQQIMDAASGLCVTEAVRVSMTVMCKEFGLGSFEPNATTDTEQTFSVNRLALSIGGKQVILVDQLNSIFMVNGVDYLASYRKDVGLN